MSKTNRLLVSGNKLGAYIGSNVAISGVIKNVSSDKMSLEMVTFDNTLVNVALNISFNEDVTENNVIDVFGTVQSRSTIAADLFASFNNLTENDVSHEDCNDFIKLVDQMQLNNFGKCLESMLGAKSK